MLERKKSSTYTPNRLMYTILLVLSILFIIGAAATRSETEPEINTIGTVSLSIGTGVFASVLIAWLIDEAGCRQKEIMNQNNLKNYFYIFDLNIHNQLEAILKECAKSDPSIDIDKCYTIHDLIVFMERVEQRIFSWEVIYSALSHAYDSVYPEAFVLSDSEQHIIIFRCLSDLRNSRNFYNNYSRNSSSNIGDLREHAYHHIKEDLPILEILYDVRDQTVSIQLSSNLKNHIQNFRTQSANSKEYLHAAADAPLIHDDIYSQDHGQDIVQNSQ